MNKLIFVLTLLVVFTFWGCTNRKKASNVNSNEHLYSLRDAFELQGEAMKSYNTDPTIAADRFLKAATAYIQNGYNKDAGLCYGNVAHLYEENFNNIDSAFILSKLGLEYAIKGNDTLNTGHSYRYSGYLMGFKNRIDEGVAQIEKSKPFYILRKNKDAIAVADYDIARVYFIGKQYDNAMKYINTSTAHFKNKSDIQRIFNNNLFALELYQTTGNKAAFETVKSENENLIQGGKISESQKLKYYAFIKK